MSLLGDVGVRRAERGRRGARAGAPAGGSGRPGGPKVVLLGDSLTAGLGLLETQSYPSLLQQKIDARRLRFEVVNAGVSGDTSAGGLRRLDWALEGDVRVLVVALGGNDGLRGLPVAEMKKQPRRRSSSARRRAASVVILAGMEAPPNYGARVHRRVPRRLPRRSRRSTA